MGIINIELEGSFGRRSSNSFSAEEGGHANAIALALAWLTAKLPAAIRRDHELAETGEYPPKAPLGSVETTN